jgi:hypothetical protein
MVIQMLSTMSASGSTENILESGSHRYMHFDIHRLLTISIEPEESPVARILANTLKPFRVDRIQPDLSIHIGILPSSQWRPRGVSVGDRMLYDAGCDETTVFFQPTSNLSSTQDIFLVMVGKLRSDGSRVAAYFPNTMNRANRWRRVLGELWEGEWSLATLNSIGDQLLKMQEAEVAAARIRLAVLEPFLYYRLPSRGASLVHAAAMSKKGKGILFAGAGHVGKTTFALEMTKRGWTYLGDDLSILTEGGEILAYPEPLRAERHHNFDLARAELDCLGQLGPLQRRMFRRMLRNPSDSFLRMLPRVKIQELIPGAQEGQREALDTVIMIRKGTDAKQGFEKVSQDEMSKMLSAELYWEFDEAPWRHSQYAYSASCAEGRDFIAEAAASHARVVEIIKSALRGAKTYKILLPSNIPSEVFDSVDAGALD